MKPLIQQIPPKKLLGKRIRTSQLTFQPYELWSKFMPKKKYIPNVVSEFLYSVQVYDSGIEVTPHTKFDQWAAVEVTDYKSIPDGMETYNLMGGLYATFIHKGKFEDFPQTMRYIHSVWLPQSAYEIDDRGHFEVLGSNYDRTSAESEEKIWIPVKPRKV